MDGQGRIPEGLSHRLAWGANRCFCFFFEKSLDNLVVLISDAAFTVYFFLSSGILLAWMLCQVISSHSWDFLPPQSTLEGSTASSWQGKSFFPLSFP